MIPRKHILFFGFGLLALLCLAACTSPGDVAGNGSDVSNPAIAGKLYNPDGTPASGVSVRLYGAGFTPSLSAAKTMAAPDTAVITDADGSYAIPLPDSGLYNILGDATDNKAVFIDSIVVSSAAPVAVAPDTVRASGRIVGISYLPGKDSINQIRVTMYIPGTGFITKPNIGGFFSFPKVPEGVYSLIFDPTYTDHFVKRLTVTVRAGQTTDLDTVILYGTETTGQPLVSAGPDQTVSLNDTVRLHAADSDPLGSIVRREWDVGATGNFIPALTGDTILVMPAFPETVACVFRVTDNDGNRAEDTIRIIVARQPPVVHLPGTWRANFFSQQQDSLDLAAMASDNGTLIRYLWARDGMHFRDTTITGTFRTAFPDSGTYPVVVMVQDDDSQFSLPETCLVTLTLDPPLAVPRGDTILLRTDVPVTVRVSARDTNQGGSIVQYYWDMNGGGWEDSTTVPYYSISNLTPGVISRLTVVWGARDNDGLLVQDTFTIDFGCPPVTRIAIGMDNSMVLKNDGTVVMWGYGMMGSTVVPPELNDAVAITAANNYSLALRSNGNIIGWGGSIDQKAIPTDLNQVMAVDAGGYANHALALKRDGTVVAWGDNFYDQCNIPAGLDRVVAIAADGSHNLALKSDSTVVTWGSTLPASAPPADWNSTYGVPVGLNRVVAIATGNNHNVSLKSDGTVVAWGDNSLGQCNVPASLGLVTAIAAAGEITVVILSDSTIRVWGGDNSSGQRNVPSGLNQVVAVAAGKSHVLALKADGSVVAWGNNYWGQCNIPAGLKLW